MYTSYGRHVCMYACVHVIDILAPIVPDNNQCCLVKNLTSGNVRWVVGQYAYIVTIVTEIEIIVCEL